MRLLAALLVLPLFLALSAEEKGSKGLGVEVAVKAAPREALLLGVGDYGGASYKGKVIRNLEGITTVDLPQMQARLEGLGFHVTALANPTRRAAEEAVDAFSARIKARPGVSLFYFSGHGGEYRGRNYLIPRGASIGSTADLEDQALNAQRVLNGMEESGGAVNLVFLDCCREDLGKSVGGAEMAPLKARGSFIGFATRSGDFADPEMQGSPYTRFLVKHMGRSGVSVADMYSGVIAEVRDYSRRVLGEERRPGFYSELDAPFYFVRGSESAVPGSGGGGDAGGMKAGGDESKAAALLAQERAKLEADRRALEEERKKMEMAKLTVPTTPVGSAVARPPLGNAGKPEVARDRGAVSGFVKVDGGTLPSTSLLGAVAVGTFYIGKYEVQWGEFQEVRTWAAAHGYDIGSVGKGDGNDYPVTGVNWYQALKWCNARSEMENKTPVYKKAYGAVYRTGEEVPAVNASANGYRLPSEKEWEWAARGGRKSQSYKYSGSADIAQVAWYDDNSGKVAHAVGTKAPNELGICDMSGNVWEWCFDLNYSPGTSRVIRGGSWIIYAGDCAVGNRYNNYPSDSDNSFGFRLALSSVP